MKKEVARLVDGTIGELNAHKVADVFSDFAHARKDDVMIATFERYQLRVWNLGRDIQRALVGWRA